MPDEAREIANAGLALRDKLNAWYEKYLAVDETDGSAASSPDTDSSEEDECGLLAKLFWSAISIYLSGEFDYEMHHWARFGLAVPTMDAASVQVHVGIILAITERALVAGGRLSPLLFLFPLRIAGTRSAWAPRAQRKRVLRVMEAISERFAVGHAIRAGLIDAWAHMGVVDV